MGILHPVLLRGPAYSPLTIGGSRSPLDARNENVTTFRNERIDDAVVPHTPAPGKILTLERCNIAHIWVVLHIKQCGGDTFSVSARESGELFCGALGEVESVIHEGLFQAALFRLAPVRGALL